MDAALDPPSRPGLRASLTLLLLTTEQKASESAQDTNRTVCMSPREEQGCQGRAAEQWLLTSGKTSGERPSQLLSLRGTP